MNKKIISLILAVVVISMCCIVTSAAVECPVSTCNGYLNAVDCTGLVAAVWEDELCADHNNCRLDLYYMFSMIECDSCGQLFNGYDHDYAHLHEIVHYILGHEYTRNILCDWY